MRLTSGLMLALLCAAPNPSAWAQNPLPKAALAKATEANELNLLLLEVRLDGSLLADSLTAYEVGNDVLLPLGEMARLLTIGITLDTSSRSAAGFVLREDQPFRLEMGANSVTLPGQSEAVDPTQLRWLDNDIYVPSRLLQRWWPIDLEFSLSALSLQVLPRETLPIQARLARESDAARLRSRGGAYQDPGFPRAQPDYRLVDVPFIDQTLGLQTSRDSTGQIRTDMTYNAFITGDLLGMEASMFVTGSQSQGSQSTNPQARLTLSRHDPDANLLGPLRARTVALGNVALPALNNVVRAVGGGNGLVVSNRPLNQPSSYGLHTLRGDLPPGWDVTLYFNDALIGFQQSRPDGLYQFADQPLVFGNNEFRLVFNGPLGQTRIEREAFLLDDTLTKPGNFYYTAGGQRGDDGSDRQNFQADFGLADNVAATAGLVSIDLGLGTEARHYSNVGLRASALGMLMSADHVSATGGGSLTEVGVRTGLGHFSVDLTHTQLSNFSSDFFVASSDTLKQRTRARLTGRMLFSNGLVLPVGLDVFREVTASGGRSLNAQGRVSLNLQNTNYTNALNLQTYDGQRTTSGALQVYRRMAGVGLSSQLAYTLEPDSRLSSVAIMADKNLTQASRVSLGLMQSMTPSVATVSAGYNRSFGSFGMGVNARYSSNGEVGIGVQLFMAIGRDPRSGNWARNWQPMAAAGAVSARAFVDANMNGLFDIDEEPVEGAGFILNGGSRHPVRTNADGVAYMSHMTPRQFADVAIDTGTLEDPQWQAATPGVRVLPRPGKVVLVDFPVVMTSEIDGTVYLEEDGKTRGIGNALLELVNERGEVVTTQRSAADGYYIVPAVKPGRYTLRLAAEQLRSLGLVANQSQPINMKADGEYVNGMDFTLRAAP
ncbi:MAG: hypothetical protein RLZZ296_283 [Pseudomonadota bacterium]|jgi:hypothetical protein